MRGNKIWTITIMLVCSISSLRSTLHQPCDPVPSHLVKLYRRLTIKRKYSIKIRKTQDLSNVSWKNSSLRFYFNTSSLTEEVKIHSADLILHRSQRSFIQTLFKQKTYKLILKDLNTSSVIYNRTLANNGRLCLVKDIIHIVKRWQQFPASNKGLLLSIKDTGFYSTTLQTFYAKKSISVPALVMFISPGNNFLKRYKLIPSEHVQILKTNFGLN